jgi:hypothetical protein
MMIQGSMTQELMSNLYKKPTKMTEEQAAKLSKFLSSFDGDNLLDPNARTIVFQVKGKEVAKGADLAYTLAGASTDPAELAEGNVFGAAKRPPPPPPPQESKGVGTVDDAILELIAATVEAYDETQEEDISLGEFILEALGKAGYDISQPVIDFYA